MENALKDTFKYYRQRGYTAAKALQAAKVAEKPKYPSQALYYNPIVKDSKGGDNMRWVEKVSEGLRLVGFADEISQWIKHKGWFTDDEFQSEVMRGVVYQMPARGGKEQYVYGYADPCNDDCAFLCFDNDVKGNKEEAARLADRIAEQYAEEEREYQEAWRAGSDYASETETIHKERVQALGLLAAMRIEKKRGAAQVICDTLRNQVKRHLSAIQEAKEKRHELIERFNSGWQKDLRSAFNEGAGETIIKA